MSHPRPVALVTGSATGVGCACAVRFAKQGFDVVVNYSRSESEARETMSLVEAAGVRALLVPCDVSNDAAVRAMMSQIEATFGRLDVLVNNAACTPDDIADAVFFFACATKMATGQCLVVDGGRTM